MNKLISIIVPVYNVEKYLHRCIDSIIAQTYSNWECILVNDGSKDKSGFICDEYTKKDARIKVIHKQNGGVSSARNAGIENSHGLYILFIDSDDYVLETYIESFFCRFLLDERDFVIQGCTCLNGDKKYEYRIEESTYSKNKISQAIADKELFKHGSPYGKLYHAGIIKDNSIRFDVRVHNYEDFLFMSDYIKFVNNIVFIPFTGYQYIMDSAGLHSKIFEPENELYLLQQYLKKTEKYKNYSEITDYAIVLVFRYFRSLYSKFKRPENFVNELLITNPDVIKYNATFNSKPERILWILLKCRMLSVFSFLMHNKYYK